MASHLVHINLVLESYFWRRDISRIIKFNAHSKARLLVLGRKGIVSRSRETQMVFIGYWYSTLSSEDKCSCFEVCQSSCWLVLSWAWDTSKLSGLWSSGPLRCSDAVRWEGFHDVLSRFVHLILTRARSVPAVNQTELSKLLWHRVPFTFCSKYFLCLIRPRAHSWWTTTFFCKILHSLPWSNNMVRLARHNWGLSFDGIVVGWTGSPARISKTSWCAKSFSCTNSELRFFSHICICITSCFNFILSWPWTSSWSLNCLFFWKSFTNNILWPGSEFWWNIVNIGTRILCDKLISSVFTLFRSKCPCFRSYFS